MTLDIVVPTYNRSDLLRRTIQSVQRAEKPRDLLVKLIVVDNNCTDGTEQLVKAMSLDSPVPIVWVRETSQGLSSARNGGIAAGKGELIGFIDDDEEIQRNWLMVVEREFGDPDVGFIGGSCVPRWGAAPPDWLPRTMPAVIGVVEAQPRSPYDAKFPGILMGGNAVLRRSVFEHVGGYDVRLGRTKKGLLSMEDDEFYQRLLSARIKGVHAPDLVIEHFIPPVRLTKKYHRSWCFWHAVTEGSLFLRKPRPVVRLFGIPRYLFGEAARALVHMPALWITGRRRDALEREMALWQLAGFAYGRYLFHGN